MDAKQKRRPYIIAVHDSASEELNLCKVPFEEAFKLQIWCHPMHKHHKNVNVLTVFVKKILISE
jgi:hypothetical protein